MELEMFAPLLFAARIIYQRHPELVTGKDIPYCMKSAWDTWSTNSDWEENRQTLQEMLERCTYLLPENEFMNITRLAAEEMALDEESCIARHAA
jgi:hypothetical protein